MNFGTGLIIGIIIGWLAELLIDFLFWRKDKAPAQETATKAPEVREVIKEVADPALKAELDACKGEVEDLKARLGAAALAPPPKPQKLSRIEGIGPKIESIFHAAGIYTFADLADKTPEDLRTVLTEGGITRITNPTTWPQQARLAALENWDALKKLQNELSGGRAKGSVDKSSGTKAQ